MGTEQVGGLRPSSNSSSLSMWLWVPCLQKSAADSLDLTTPVCQRCFVGICLHVGATPQL